MMGEKVNLFDVDAKRIEQLNAKRTIKMTGVLEGEYVINKITNDIGCAIEHAELIIVILPTVYHENVARLAAPYLKDGQVVILNPGGTGGALEFMSVIRAAGCRADVTVAETNSMIYACRAPVIGEVHVFGMKKLVHIAALPAKNIGRVIELTENIYPQFTPVDNVLYTSLNNTTAMVHPVPMILNSARIESGIPFEYYSDGFTKSVADVVESLDAERMAIGDALGIKLASIVQWYKYRYGVEGESLYEAIHRVDEYDGIAAPSNLNVRYLFEDLPTGLVPMAEFGKLLGVKAPVMNAAIDFGNALLHRDFRADGRTLKKLGLEGKKIEEMLSFVS